MKVELLMTMSHLIAEINSSNNNIIENMKAVIIDSESLSKNIDKLSNFLREEAEEEMRKNNSNEETS